MIAPSTCSTCHGFLLSCKLIKIWKRGDPDSEIQVPLTNNSSHPGIRTVLDSFIWAERYVICMSVNDPTLNSLYFTFFFFKYEHC